MGRIFQLRELNTLLAQQGVSRRLYFDWCVCVSGAKCALVDNIILIQLISQHILSVHAIEN